MRLPLAVGACGSPVQAATLRVYAIDYALVRRTMRSHLTADARGYAGVRAATLRVYTYVYALVRRTMRLPLAAGACGSPVQAATLRVYTYVYALVRRTMRSHLTADACGYAGSGRRPCGSTPTSTLSCVARCACPLAAGACGSPVQTASLRVYAIDYALVRRTM